MISTQNNRYTKYIAREAIRRLGEYYSWPAENYTGSDVLFHLIGQRFSTQEQREPIQSGVVFTKALPTIAAISYTLEEQIYPLFDYAQFYPVGFLRGSYMITGTMAIYYSERDLLFKQIQDFYFPDAVESTPLPDFTHLSDDEKNALLDELIGISVDIENSGSEAMNQRILDMIRGLKTSVWEPTNQYINNTSANPLTDNSYQPKFTEPEFNLLITHGPLGISAHSQPGILPNINMIDQGQLGRNSILNLEGLIEKQKLTSRVLYGVQVLSHATRYNNDGQPIVDEYEFVAKDEMSLENAFGTMVTGGDINDGLDELIRGAHPPAGEI